MRAVVLQGFGGVEVLEVREVPTPEPGPDQIRVRVRATALNRADLLQRMGFYPAPPGAPADIPGLEFAGEVSAVGAGVSSPRVGDRVFGIVGGGGYAEELVTHARAVARIPDGMDFVQAAAVPEAFITAHDALFTQARLRPGERVLVHAVGSGVGITAVQIASALGCETFGTARSADKLERAKGFGLAHAIAPEGFAEAVMERTRGEGVDVVVDFVGGDYLDGNLRSLAEKGRLVVVGLMGGTHAEIDLRRLLNRRLTVVGTVLRARPLEEKIAATQAFAREVVPLLAAGKIRPVVDEVLPLDRVREAHEHMAANANFGKIVLTT